VWFCVVLRGSAWTVFLWVQEGGTCFCCSVVLCGSVWFCVVLCDSVWFCVVPCGLCFYGSRREGRTDGRTDGRGSVFIWFCMDRVPGSRVEGGGSVALWFCVVPRGWFFWVREGGKWFRFCMDAVSGSRIE